MTTINSTGQTTGSTTNTSSSTSTSKTSSSSSGSYSDKASAALGKQDFLKLLVAQMKNQDPLNPDNPTDFTAQLAQFSSLEQLFNLNDSMTNLATSYSNTEKLSSLNTIGKEVAYPTSSFSYSGQPVQLGYTLDSAASNVSLAIMKNGSTVAVLKGTDLTKGTHYLTWDGLNTQGQAAANGDYSIVIKAEATEGSTVSATSIIKSEVTGVDLDADANGMLLTEAGKISFSKILGIFDKKTTTTSSSSTNNSSTSTNSTNASSTTTDTVTGTAAAAVAAVTGQTGS